MNTGKTIAKASILILGLTLLSRFLGLGREMAIAYSFGATTATDAFLVAFIIPYAFYSVVGVALSTVIVPVFAEYNGQDRREEAWQVMSLVVNAVFVVMVAMALIGTLGASLIAWALGAGFSPEVLQLATRLTAVMMPSIIFMSLAGVFGGILNANNVFGPPAFGPAAMNLVIIFATLLGGQWFGIYGLAVGGVIGSLVFVLVQLPALRRIGFKYSLCFDMRHPEVRRIVAMMLPVVLASSVGQIYLMIDWRLASDLAEGSIAALNYASKLMLLPQGLFVMAVTTAIFPTLSRLVAEERQSDMAATLRRGMKVILLLAVPGAVGLIVLRDPIVILLFQRGAFDAQATAMTTGALLFFAVGLAAFCLNMPLTRGFFAMQDTKTPLLITVATVGIKLILSLILVRYLFHAGLALASSLTAIIDMFILSWVLQRRLPGLFDWSFFRFAGNTIVASIAMGSAVYFLDGYLAAYIIGGGLALAARVGLDIACGALVFTAAGLILRLDEFGYLLEMARGFIKQQKEALELSKVN